MILQELQNIFLTNIFYFALYAYRNFNKNNIKSLPHIGDLQTKTFQGHYLKHVILQELQNISLTNIFYFASYAYRNFNRNNIKSLPHTGDLQTKTFQGHYLKHVILQELQNISLTNIFYFASYAYRNFNGINIKSLPRTGDLQTKTFQGHYLKHVILKELQNISLTNIFYFVCYYYKECILKNIKSLPHTGETSKARLSKVTNSNTLYYKNCRTFFLQISFILCALVYMLFLTSKTYQDRYQSYIDIISTKSEK